MNGQYDLQFNNPEPDPCFLCDHSNDWSSVWIDSPLANGIGHQLHIHQRCVEKIALIKSV